MVNWSFLDYFVAAAREENFSKAANSLFYSQSYLSKRIAALEEELGVPLFERHGKRVVLTPAGERLYEGILKINQKIGELEREMEQLRKERDGIAVPISVYADPYAQGIVTELLQHCRALYPEYRYELVPEVFAEAGEWQGIRCFYSADGEVEQGETFYVDQEKIYINKNSPVAGKRRLKWADLAGHTCVTIRTVPRQMEWERKIASKYPEITFRQVDDVFEAMSVLCSCPTAFEIWNAFSQSSIPLYNTVGIPMDDLSALSLHIELRGVPKEKEGAFLQVARNFCRSIS